MWSTEAMLTLVFFVLFSNLSILQYADSATTPGTQPTPTPPATTPTPGTGTPGQQPTGQTPGNLWEASSRLANVLGEVVQRFIQYKKNSLSSGLGVVANMLNNTSQLGTGQVGTPTSPPAGNPQTPTTPTETPATPAQPAAQPNATTPART